MPMLAQDFTFALLWSAQGEAREFAGGFDECRGYMAQRTPDGQLHHINLRCAKASTEVVTGWTTRYGSPLGHVPLLSRARRRGARPAALRGADRIVRRSPLLIVELRGRVAVVTGAAGGIGLALCERFAAEGMSVVMADVDPVRLGEASSKLAARYRRSGTRRADRHLELAGRRGSGEGQRERFGSVHVLCNNAGVTLPGVTWEYSREEWEWVIGVNLLGVVHGIRAFVPSMLAHGEPAHVVNTASIGGLMSFPGLAPYAATKYGVVGLSETLAQDLAGRDASSRRLGPLSRADRDGTPLAQSRAPSRAR